MAPIIAIVGPTASGKTALAIDIALKYGGEIICADSRTVYKGMDIGTAKPTAHEQSQVRHHLLDVTTPDKHYSAAQFQTDAKEVIKQLHSRARLPIVVGGSGLYVDGLLYDFTFSDANPELRTSLEGHSLSKLQEIARKRGIDVSEQTRMNKRHLLRAIERGKGAARRELLRPSTLILGMQVQKVVLESRIEKRVDTMINSGLIAEVKMLLDIYGAESPGMLAPGYKAVIEHISGRLSLEESKELFIRSDKQLAKRQMTWFKRSSDIHWASTQKEAEQIVETFLSKFATIHT